MNLFKSNTTSNKTKVKIDHKLRSRIYHWTHQCQLPPRQWFVPTVESVIDKLPVEMVMHVASFLEPADASAFALANKYLRACLDGYSNSIDQAKLARWDLLNRLEKDEPDMHRFVCPECARFHLRDPKREQFSKHSAYPRFCAKSAVIVLNRHLDYAVIHKHICLEWTIVHLIMRAHRFQFSLYGAPLGILTIRSVSSTPHHDWRVDTDGLILDGKLFFQITYKARIKHPLYYRKSVSEVLSYAMQLSPGLAACIHTPRRLLAALCACALSHVEASMWVNSEQQEVWDYKVMDSCHYCQGLKRCTDCPTEFIVRCTENSSGCDLSITKWIDLGNGTSPVLSREWCALTQRPDEFTASVPFTCYVLDEDESVAVRYRRAKKMSPDGIPDIDVAAMSREKYSDLIERSYEVRDLLDPE